MILMGSTEFISEPDFPGREFQVLPFRLPFCSVDLCLNLYLSLF
jgi:hypothetical protein